MPRRPRLSRRSGKASRERARTHCRPGPLPCASAAKDPGTAGIPTLPGDAACVPWLCAGNPSEAATGSAQAASEWSEQGCRRSRPYRKHRERGHEREKNQTQILPNGQELEAIEPIGSKANSADDGRVQGVPDLVVKLECESRRPDI